MSTDEQFIRNIADLNATGDIAARNEAIKKHGGMDRLIALAARGVARAKRAAPKRQPTFLPDDFPDTQAREDALDYWRKRRRPDLIAMLEQEIDAFRARERDTKTINWRRKWCTCYTNAPKFNTQRGATLHILKPKRRIEIGEWVARLEMFYGLHEDCPKGSWAAEEFESGPPGSNDCRAPQEAFALFEARHGRRSAIGQ